MFSFKLPDLGEGIHEGEIIEWHVKEGDTIEEDAPLLDVETDKATVTIPSPRAGKVVTTNGEPGDMIEVGSVLVVIDDGSEEPAPAAAPKTTSASKPESEAAFPNPDATSTPSGARKRVPAAPATRRLARELGVDINQVQPTGPAGRVTPEDVKRFADSGDVSSVKNETPPKETPTPAKPASSQFTQTGATPLPFLELEPLPDFSRYGEVEVEPMRSVRRKTARRMVTAKLLVPHVAHLDEADVTDLEAMRADLRPQLEGQPGGRLNILPFVAKAVISALKQYPMFNASVDPFQESIIYKKYYGLGVAVDSPRGLLVPVIPQADRHSVLTLSAHIEQLALKARENQLQVQNFEGGTFTLSNIGALGGTASIPVVNYPECAILVTAAVREQPRARDGQVVVRKILPLCLSFDHRVADGAHAARFLNHIKRLLEQPASLLVEG